MKFVQQISIVLIGVIYFITTFGILIYKTNCECTGEEQVTVFVSPESCGKNFHQHHDHDEKGIEISVSENNCHECSSHTNECGCESPEINFFKLLNQFGKNEVLYLNVYPIQILTALVNENHLFVNNTKIAEPIEFYIDPPPVFNSTLDFIIQIQQLKIPNIC